jgi:hypothetical protein
MYRRMHGADLNPAGFRRLSNHFNHPLIRVQAADKYKLIAVCPDKLKRARGAFSFGQTRPSLSR